MADAVPWARLVMVAENGDRLELALVNPAKPDLGTVENLARLQLQARRAGFRVWLCDIAPALKGLLDLTGLLREVGGQAESGEEAFGIQEGVDPGDPVA
jgi:hypothetical protein